MPATLPDPQPDAPGIEDVLENAAWHALAGPQATLAESVGRAHRYRADVALFAAVPDEPDGSDWATLASLVGAGGVAVLFRVRPVTPPDGWTLLYEGIGRQMVATDVEPGPMPGRRLTDADVPAMLDLVGRTQPGPFFARTIEMGAYYGVEDGGALVAMAGERLRPAGATEISAVCVDPAYRGRGLAAALVRGLVGRITERGETPFLHVVADNAPAIALYTALGFTTRADVLALGLRPPR